MAGGFEPPKAPDANEPARWEAPVGRGEDGARVVVATTTDAPPVVQSGEHPPRNGQAMAALGIALAGVALLVLSRGVSFAVTLPFEIIAVALGRQGRRRAQREGIGGWRAARWGTIIGIVAIALCIVAAIVWILIWVLDLDVGTDVGGDGPSAPTEPSTIAASLSRHL
jgi:hypothetical protein